MKLPLPDDWTWYESPTKTWNPFSVYGYCLMGQRLVTFYPKKWMWPKFVYNFFRDRVYQHEVSHAWGITGCRKPWCIMFESRAWKAEWSDKWWEKPVGAIFQLLTGFKYCKEHREFINKEMVK